MKLKIVAVMPMQSAFHVFGMELLPLMDHQGHEQLVWHLLQRRQPFFWQGYMGSAQYSW